MVPYTPPVQDMIFTLRHVVGVDDAVLDEESLSLILGGAGAFTADVLAPLNQSGDKEGCRLENGRVVTPDRFKKAYEDFCLNGWNGVSFSDSYGGGGLPRSVAFAVQEMVQAANMGFGLCPLLTQGAVEAIERYASEEQKAFYLPNLVSGKWAGTMLLTEPQAGSDLSIVRSTAEKAEGGAYRLKGQKIFITHGDHDWTENIIHMVLARTGTPEDGIKGLSLFIVPKILEDGARNDIVPVALEHKLGIHASPTCVMQMGDEGEGAVGYLVGEEGAGMRNMFAMMNNARLSVGLQGVAIADRAYQKALSFAEEERVQGGVLISQHPDVKRMLTHMRAVTEAGRVLACTAGHQLDLAGVGDEAAQARVDLLTPIVKAWCTDMAVEAAGLGKQVHGGMGYIEETGAAQYIRDAHILTIYEGTNGIQANDLVFRKVVPEERRAAVEAFFTEARETVEALSGTEALDKFQDALGESVETLEKSTAHLWALSHEKRREDMAAVAVPYLSLFGVIAGAAMLAKSAIAAQRFLETGQGDSAFCEQKLETFAFYIRHILPHAQAYGMTVMR